MNSVALRLDDLHVAVRKNKLVYVDGVRVELPVSPHSSVRVSLVGSFVVVQTDFGLQLKFNGDDELFVVVDERYKGQLCGLCGTYTDDQLDDFLKPDGILALDSNQFGNSWRVTDDDWLCNQTAPPPPTCEPSSNEEAEEHCKIILASNGPFKDCHWYIPPQLYFESCVYDYCATGGDSVLLCNALKSYASACDAAGVVLGDWREQSGCVDTSCALDCNFDVDLCNWTQSKTDNLDWKRRSGSTPSAHTGPSYDHTTAGGYYIYIEGNDGSEGDRAQLISAPCKKAGAQCLRFWYHMYGVARSMALKVYQVEGGIPVLMWSETGNKGNKWIAGEVGLHLSGNSQILIEAVRGNDYRSDVAVDDISFHTGCCGDMCDTTATSTPTTANTVTPGITESSCTVQGDPHYNTFDKQAHDFMGTCTYTLSKLCDINSNLPYFNVEAANEHRSGNSYVSYVKHVNVNVYNHRITLEKGRVVKVDGQVEVLPVSVASGVHVGLSGKYVVVSTNFGLRVRFDGRHRAEVTLRSVFKGKVCGMCGNYNDDRTDDFLNPDGVMELDSVSLGNSWQTQNDTRCIPDIGIKPNCTDDEKHTIESKSHCGIIIDSGGPFKECHSVIDPKAYFGDCVYDLCVLDLQTGSLCSSLQSYADACQSKGVRVDAWRNETFCPLKCAVNSHYEQCGSACPATCVNPNAPSSCSQPCVEGCVCDSGYVFYNDRCVPRSQCGCWSGDKHYPVGSEFWTDDTCSTKCQCPSAGSKLVCRSSTCGTDSFCGVANGVPGCYPHAYGICRVHNDPHYNTFDKATHHFMGTCTYTIAKLCANSSSLPYFNIEAKNENRGNAKVSYVQRVGVSVHGHSVWIVRGESHRVLVDEVWTTLPVTLVGGAVSVSRSGRYVVLATDFGLGVSYDTDHSVEVKVPSRYFNQTCGMCGNYNGLREDDYMKPDGEQAKDSNELGNSWKVPPDDAGCDPGSLGECEPADEILYQSDDFCGLITSQQGPFVKCHSVINPSGTFESCVVELCLLAGSRDALCNVLQIYADACQSAGMTIPLWRNSTSCPVKCPKNSHYNACGSACPATCTDRFAPENCSKPCVEDCECNMDFVLSGSSCVPVEKCGCIYNNKYYEKGTVFWDEGCLQRCRCTGNDRVECEAAFCGPEEICKVQDGNLGCHRADTANCHIYGDPHYTTFDSKLYHFQGACNYTVTETCGNTSVQFSVTSRNEHRGSPTWSAMNSVALRLDDLHVAVRKNKLVYVDGVRVELPVSPHSSVRVSLVGSFVVVQTDFGLQLKFNGDDELFVVVDERYKGQLCGLCGTYTDDQLDDFLKPDGILALDSNQFGNSWRVTDDDWLCNQTAPPPPTCEPSSNEEAEEHCKIILASNGPFKDCHWYIPPQLYFESCVYDYCATGGDSVLLCNALKSYASACDAAGVVLGDWREQSGCVDTSCALDCNFDVDLCNWTQSKTDNLDWKRRSGSTPSAHTGPSYDHTTAGGYYIYIEGNDGSEGDRAQLISAPCKKAGAQCLRFWYHMYGVARSMALKVYQVEGGIPVLMWSETGNKGNKWIAGEVGLHLSGNSQILIEAVRGNDYRSDVAVDDISFHTGCCGDMCDTTATSTPTTANTVTPGITESSCTVQGDPHYNTFDKQAHDFMGTCTYTLSKLCDINSNLPYFNVEAANEHRSGNSYVSYVKHVNVNVYNHRITLEKGRVVKVDGQVEVLPVSVASGVHVGLSGKYVVVSTNFGLRVRFDGRHRAEVTLRSVFKGKVCGMCGNYNDDRTDDFLNPDGVMELDSVSLGNSWQTQNDTRCIPDIGIKPNCTDDEKHTIESKSHCGIIIDSGGPFKECHSVIDPKAYFGDCVYDLCVLDLQTGSLCSSLQSYADACQSKGVRVDAWRNETFCPLKCAVNSHYEQCGSACPATCVNPNAPSSCSQPCVEGCVCDSGYVFYNDRCVPRSQCGCWSGDKHYPVGSEFWTDDTCSTKCQCPSAGSKLVCRSSTCGTDSFCGVANGVPGCYPHAYGICRVHNDPHYNTFDKATHHFMGTCTYTIAKLCANSSSLPYFNIEAKNENRGNAKVSYVQRVGVSVHGHSVWIVRGESHRVLVDEVWTTLPVTLVGGAVSVSRSGRYVVLATDFGLGVSYDTDHSVEVKVPSRYFNQTCGMCGNYNGLREDDYMKPDGEQAKDSNELGNSWKVPPDDAGCDPGSLGECEPADEILYQSDDFCGLITSQQGPFVKCHSVINPSGTFESCVVELCLLAGSRDALCNVLQIYADACQSAGMTIPLWRNSTSCPVKCPKNSHYNACGSACPATCTDRFAPENCSKPCVEDCECNMDFVLSGSSCVPVEKCGCIYNNKYYEVDGVRVELPVSPHSSVRVSLVGSFVVVQTDFGLQLKFNGDDELFVVVDERYKGQLCGLCGTYTDDQLDDFLKPDGILALDSNQFGNSWRVTDDDWLCNQTAPPPPTCEPSSNEEAEEHCKIILASNGPFKDCHWYIPPQLYFESCVYDYCATGGDSVLLCNALRSYASACDAAGVVLGDWREQSGCVDTSCALDCNFDVDLCNWTQSKTDNLDWKRRSGSTPSAHTGPSYDHTTAGGYYIYIEGNDGSEGDRAQLISAPCKKAGAQCLRFWYHMYGVARSMALKVYQVEGGIPVLMWSETGNKGNKWIAGEVGLHLSGNSQILIEAVRGNDYRSDVAVDDISFHTGCCGVTCLTTASTVSPTTTSTVTPDSTGNYNGDPGDDIIMPNGSLATDSNKLGESWQVPDGVTEYNHGESVFKCDPNIKENAEKETACGMITDLTGVFKECHVKVPPENYFDNCVYDTCMTGGQPTTLCFALQTYADLCAQAGVCIEWRNNPFCPVSCPGGSHYERCGTSCPATCTDLSAPDNCLLPTVEGCFCDPGYVLSVDKCVPSSQCGCVDENNKYYQIGEIWLTPHCAQKCSCGKGGEINCTDYGCSPNENCSLKKNGQYICRSTGFTKCTIGGKPYYLAFDGLVHHFPIKRLYTLAETSDIPNRLQKFRIVGKNAPLKEGKGTVHLQEIFIEVYNHTVQFKDQRKLVVDGELVKPPVQPHDSLRIYQRSNRLHLETDFGLAISFDEKDNSDVTLPITYRKWVRGLCGNFEGKRINHLTKHDEARITEVKHFGESWDIDRNRPAAGKPGIADRQRQHPITDEDLENIELDTGFDMLCSKTELKLIKGTSYCGIISDPVGPFSNCHRFISPEQYQMHCIFSMCTMFNITEMMCPSLEQYARHCQEHEVTLGDWRKDALCAIVCPSNSRYTMQMSACPASCSNLAAPSECEAPAMEGCECLPGFVLSDFQCVPYKDCGCTYQNKYYEVGKKFMTEDCSETCVCIGTATVNCTRALCAPNATCSSIHLIRGCYQSGPCLNNPCENGGICQEVTNEADGSPNFHCHCPITHEGPHCEKEKSQDGNRALEPASTKESTGSV
ncbi:IgGFc-binding protein-like [Cetorhinus maximus]